MNRVRLLSWLAVLLLFSLAGCWSLAPRPEDRLARLAAATLAHSPVGAAQLGVRSFDDPRRPGYGKLALAITWPSGPGRDLRGFHAQLIPDSTALIRIAVLGKGGQVAGADVVREAGQATASVTLTVRAYAGLSVVASARNAAGDEIARGTAAGVTISRNRTSVVPLIMTSLYVPEIVSFPAAAVAGFKGQLAGRLLVLDGVATPSVTIGGLEAPVTGMAKGSGGDPDTLDIVVPEGVATGRVVVTVDGVPSSTDATLWVPSGFQIATRPNPNGEHVDPDPSRRHVVFQDVLTFEATHSWVFSPGDSAASFSTQPLPEWRSGDRAVADFGQDPGLSNDLLASSRAGDTACTANLGGVISNQISVSNRLLGPFHDAGRDLTELRARATAERIGNYLYVIGGGQDGLGSRRTVERAAVGADDSVDEFGAAGIPQMITPRGAHGSAVVGDYLYVVGGIQGGWGLSATILKTLERAMINPDGTLQDFASAPVQLTRERANFSVAVLGRYVYAIGGADLVGAVDTIERAPILDARGNLGAFQDYSGTSRLTRARSRHEMARMGDTLFILGGLDDSTVEGAEIGPDGDLGPFKLVATMGGAHDRFAVQPIGDYLVAIQSHSGSGQPLIEYAPFRDSVLGEFADSGLTERVARFGPTSAVIGRWLYMIGGKDVIDVDRARIPYGGSGELAVSIDRSPPTPTPEPAPTPTPEPLLDYDVARDFSTTQNPNGAWSYGWKSDLSSALQRFDRTVQADGNTVWDSNVSANSWRNDKTWTQFGVAPGRASIHPGSGGQPCTMRWTAPRSARVRAAGYFGTGDSGVLDYYIQHNGAQLFEYLDGTVDAPFDLTRDVQAGDVLDFMVTGGYGNGNTPLILTIREVQP